MSTLFSFSDNSDLLLSLLYPHNEPWRAYYALVMSGTSLNLVLLYARDNVENLILNTTLAVDLDMNGINKNNRIISFQTPGESL